MIGKLSNQMYMYLQSVQAYIGAPITAVFITGILWRGATGIGAIATLVVGMGLGLCRFIIDILKSSFGWEPESFGPLQVLIGHSQNSFMTSFLNYCLVIFALCLFVMVIVSHFTRSTLKASSQTENLTFSLGTMSKGLCAKTVVIQVILTLIVLGITTGIILYFA